MENNVLRETLAAHLDKLKRNLALVSLSELKTTYQKPYNALCQDICSTASEYTKHISLKGIRIRKELFEEARPLIQAAINDSGLLKQISAAAFDRQSITEIDSLALALRERIQKALEPFYARYLGLYLAAECFNDPPETPMLYCTASGCILHDGKWIPLEEWTQRDKAA